MRQRLAFDDGWLFHLGELADPPARRTLKSGACGSVSDCVEGERGALRVPPGREVLAGFLPAFAPSLASARRLDGAWAPVELPHDWRILQPYVPDGGNDVYPQAWQGFLPAGVAYYRKTFTAPAAWADGRVGVDFDGVMRASTVWINGHLLGENGSGYTSFGFDISDLLRYGDEGDNVLLVRCDVSEPEGWWGEGAGIYRHVWLTATGTVSIARHGVYARAAELADAHGLVDVDVAVRNDSGVVVAAALACRLVDDAGAVVAEERRTVELGGDATTWSLRLAVPQPRRWSVEKPQLYRLATALSVAGEAVDEVSVPFGFRSLEFVAGRGFFLNGERVQINGVNLHQDFAGVGIAVPDRVIDYKLEALRDMGCNAIRSAHHQPNPHLLDACDRLGIMVICENRHLTASAAALADLEELVTAGRNHPCVIAWGLENEEFLEATPTGRRVLRTLVRRVKSLDPTRATTLGGCNGLDDGFYDEVDVAGYNYASSDGTFDRHHGEQVQRCLLATEDSAIPATRGCYADDPERGHLSEYGTRVDPFDLPSVREPGRVWQFYAQRPHIAGAFVWAGFDYRGEPYPLGWPCIGSHYGVMDSCGFPKARYWLLRSFYRDEPLVHLMPHWNWAGREGEPIEVVVYSNCDEVELALNGRSLGARKPDAHTARWTVPYEPGELSASGRRGAMLVASAGVTTTGDPAAVNLRADRQAAAASRHDVVVFVADVVDAAGRLVPTASDSIAFSATGGRVVGVGNGDPADHDPDVASQRRAFAGRCLVIVAPDPSAATMVVEARAPGLRAGRSEVSIVSLDSGEKHG